MDNLVQQGISAYKTGKRDEARKIFITVVKQNPNSEIAWGWMFELCIDNKERIYCLQQMLRINPGNKKTRDLLEQFKAQLQATATPPQKEITQPKKVTSTKLPPAPAPVSKKVTTSKNRSCILWLVGLFGVFIALLCLWGVGVYIMSSDPQSSNTANYQSDNVQSYLAKLSPIAKSLDNLHEELKNNIAQLQSDLNLFDDQNWRKQINSILDDILSKASELENIEPVPQPLEKMDEYLDQAASENKQMVSNFRQYLNGNYGDTTYLLRALENIDNSNVYVNLAVEEMNNYSNP